jgi:drug/metabolite transporter (DMT)-like permease
MASSALPGSRPRDYALLIFGVFACSLAVIFIKQSTSHPIWLAGIRLLIAAVFLTPLVVIEARRSPGTLSMRSVITSAPGGLVLAFHFITWAMGARMTSAANGSLIVNLTTVVMPIVMWMMNRERITRGEIIGTLIALSGVLLSTTSRVSFGEGVGGDLMCFGSMILFCIYLAFGRRHGMGKNLWLYVVPLYYIAGITCVLIAVATPGIPLPPITTHEVALLVCLGLVPTVMGHSIMNWCIKSMRGQVVSIANLFQFAFAGVIAYFTLNETPQWMFYPMCVLIILGSAIVIRSHRTTVDVNAEG